MSMIAVPAAGAVSHAPGPVLRVGRIASIDVMRALTVLLMITVNEWHPVQGLPDWMKHYPADADAMSFVDMVFPAFLFIVGMSIPFALQQRAARGDSFGRQVAHVVQRGLGLVLIGVFMVNAESGFNADRMLLPIAAWALLSYLAAFWLWGGWRGQGLGRVWRCAGVLLFVGLALAYRGGPGGEQGMSPQWWGILGLIGWAYLGACLVYLLAARLGERAAAGLLAGIALCLGYYLLGQRPDPGPGLALLLSQGGQASHIAIVLSGCLCALIYFQTGTSARRALLLALLLAFAAAWLATWLRPDYKISKIHATPSWALYSVAACVLIYALLHGLTRAGTRPLWPALLGPVAAHPLLAYLLPFVLGWLMQLLGLQGPALLNQGLPGLLWAPLFALLIAVAVRWLDARGISLRI
ncbi:DUF5009 domain-containing protein [Roseateles cavernae]|uniref:DUF5009 domain-containing protein n=1 Tax=Roseateles cavernae TaxID=3153578 RepID=UPI0032E3733D